MTSTDPVTAVTGRGRGQHLGVLGAGEAAEQFLQLRRGPGRDYRGGGEGRARAHDRLLSAGERSGPLLA